jgi:hypothetical protein
MFSILVNGNREAWETDHLMRMDQSRFKLYSDSEHESIVLEKRETLKGLQTAPALLIYEDWLYETGKLPAATVRYGFLKNIRLLHSHVFFNFLEERAFDHAIVKEFATRLGFGDWESNITH